MLRFLNFAFSYFYSRAKCIWYITWYLVTMKLYYYFSIYQVKSDESENHILFRFFLLSFIFSLYVYYICIVVLYISYIVGGFECFHVIYSCLPTRKESDFCRKLKMLITVSNFIDWPTKNHRYSFFLANPCYVRS